MRRTQYRQLRPGEEPPPGEPKRYTSDKRGYVRLRWKVGPASYVETYEQVAAEVGRDPATVSRALRAAGVLPRRQGAARKVNDVPPRTRQFVQARAGMRCERCGKPLVWSGGHIHHKQTRALGNHEPDNLLYLCPECHEWAHRHPAQARDEGVIVSRYMGEEREQ